MRDVPASQVGSLERLKDRTGTFVLAGSAADAVIYEASRYKQGLLTYSLLEGMRGAALKDEEFVDVDRLINHAVERVPQLAAGIGGVQRPQKSMPHAGGTFDIGRLTAANLSEIKMTSPVPMIVRAQFQDANRHVDHLRLAQQVNGRLRDLAADANRAPFVFVDVPDGPEAYVIGGSYVQEGDTLALDVRLVQRDEEIHQWTLRGSTSEVDRLIEDLLMKVLGVLQPSKTRSDGGIRVGGDSSRLLAIQLVNPVSYSIGSSFLWLFVGRLSLLG
jgi:hypothetical protein